MNDESQPVLTDEKSILVFWEEAKPNGLHIGQYNRVLMCRVTVPGDNKSAVEYMVDEEYPEAHPHPIFGKLRKNDIVYKRFGKYIEAHKGRTAGTVQAGTPVEAWPVVNRAQVAMLRHNCVYSVEALAGLTDSQIATLGMDGRKLVQQAKDYLATAANSQAAMEALERERKTEERFAALEEKFTDLAGALETLPEEAKAQVKAHLKAKNPPQKSRDAA